MRQKKKTQSENRENRERKKNKEPKNFVKKREPGLVIQSLSPFHFDPPRASRGKISPDLDLSRASRGKILFSRQTGLVGEEVSC